MSSFTVRVISFARHLHLYEQYRKLCTRRNRTFCRDGTPSVSTLTTRLLHADICLITASKGPLTFWETLLRLPNCTFNRNTIVTVQDTQSLLSALIGRSNCMSSFSCVAISCVCHSLLYIYSVKSYVRQRNQSYGAKLSRQFPLTPRARCMQRFG